MSGKAMPGDNMSRDGNKGTILHKLLRQGIRLPLLALLFAIPSMSGSSKLLATFNGERVLSLYNIHNKESLEIVYKKDGKMVPGAHEKLNYFMRDWRTNEPTRMDPRLFDILWEIHTELGSKKPIHLISGYRSRKTNERLRRKRGGQARNSRHIRGMATDVHFPDISARRLRYSAMVRERGGVGYYPNSALPFVHIDTGRVRHWPRMPRYELALLFPNGRSKHVPSGGRPINKNDVKIAQKRHKKMAVRMAAFHQFRSSPRTSPSLPTTLVASLDPIAKLLSAPRLMALGGRQLASLSLTPPNPRLLHRASLSQATTPRQMASLAPRPAARALLPAPMPLPAKITRKDIPATETSQPASRPANRPANRPVRRASYRPPGQHDAHQHQIDKINWPTGWAGSPEFDDEHPDELSYRPFAVAPLLTETASIDDPALNYLSHPDNAAIMETIAAENSPLPMKFRPGLQFAELLWADRFAGDAVAVSLLLSARRDHAGRPIHTARQ